MARQITLPVKGVDFPNRDARLQGRISRRFELATCRPGEPVRLVAEPGNPVDPNAVLILSARDVPLGYVPAERAPLIARLLKQREGVPAIFQGIAGTTAFIRLSLDGTVPVLPPLPPAVDGIDEEPDYFTDPPSPFD
jgi:hypothetical protein